MVLVRIDSFGRSHFVNPQHIVRVERKEDHVFVTLDERNAMRNTNVVLDVHCKDDPEKEFLKLVSDIDVALTTPTMEAYKSARDIAMLDETGNKKYSFLIYRKGKTYSFRDVQVLFKTLCDTIDDLNTSCKLTEEQLDGVNKWAVKAEKLLAKTKNGITKLMDIK